MTPTRRLKYAQEQGWRCFYCRTVMGKSLPLGRHPNAKPMPWDVTIEHLQPRAMGGRQSAANCVAACWECNQRMNAAWVAVKHGSEKQLRKVRQSLV